jgi:hypothetical protein
LIFRGCWITQRGLEKRKLKTDRNLLEIRIPPALFCSGKADESWFDITDFSLTAPFAKALWRVGDPPSPLGERGEAGELNANSISDIRAFKPSYHFAFQNLIDQAYFLAFFHKLAYIGFTN